MVRVSHSVSVRVMVSHSVSVRVKVRFRITITCGRNGRGCNGKGM